MQFLSTTQLEALISALHKTVQRGLPVTMVGAGLPQIAELAGDAKSYSERLFKFPRIGNLDDKDARAALVEPAQDEGADYSDEALDLAIEVTGGSTCARWPSSAPKPKGARRGRRHWAQVDADGSYARPADQHGAALHPGPRVRRVYCAARRQVPAPGHPRAHHAAGAFEEVPQGGITSPMGQCGGASGGRGTGTGIGVCDRPAR